MHLLVTGGAGFIGSNFVQLSCALVGTPGGSRWGVPDTLHITVLDAFTYAANSANLAGLPTAPSAPVAVQVVRGDICDVPLVNSLVAGTGSPFGPVDKIVHFAAESHNDNALHAPQEFVRTNVLGTQVLIDAAVAHGVHLHHISTDEVFGDLALDEPRRFDLDTPYRPSSPYSASKAGADHLVRAAVRSLGLQATISNCSNNYGPRQHPEKFIPRQLANLLSGLPARIYGSGANVRDWIHVDDHNTAVWAILSRGQVGKTYLIGADGERSNLEIAQLLYEVVAEVAPQLPLVPLVQVTDRPGHDRRYAIDPSSIRSLGWEPQYQQVRAGLKATTQWYLENRPLWEPAWQAAEARYAEREQVLPVE